MDFLTGFAGTLDDSAQLKNNSGAIKDGPFAKSQPGYAGNDGKGFATFKTPQDGERAQAALLSGPSYKGKSPAQVIQRYAPPGPENSEASVRNYIGYVSQRAGIDPDKPIPAEKMAAFQAAQREFETGNRPAVKFKPYGGAIAAGAGAKGGSTGRTPQTIDTVIPDISTIAATAAEQAAMGQPYDGVQSPFDPDLKPKLKGAIAEEGKRLSFADAILQQTILDSQETRAGLREKLETTVAAKRAINDQTAAELARLGEVAKPVWEKREKLAKQMLSLDEMNPLEQGIRSLFDPNYNRQALRAEIRSQDEGLAALDDVFNERQAHSKLLASLATTNYQDQESLANLILQDGGENVRLALQSFSVAGQQVDTLLTGLKTDSSLMAARAQARNDVLAGLTIGQINSGLGAAQASPSGTVEIQGIPIRAGELQEVQARLQQQSLQMANTKIAIQQGNIEVAEANKKAVLGTMTIPDLQSAIANDGVVDGVQFDVTELASRMQSLQQSNQVVSNQLAIESAPGIASDAWSQVAGTHRIQYARFAALLGSVPGEASQFGNIISAQARQWSSGLTKAKEAGVEDEYIASTLPQIQALITEQQKIVEKVVNRWAGSNADLKAVGTAWMTGQPINAESAVKGLIHFARNGIPAGTKFEGPSAQMLKVIQEELEVNQAAARGVGRGSMTIEDLGRGSDKESERDLVRRVQARLGEEYNGAMGLELYNSVPMIARELKMPFSRITTQQWQDATAFGDAKGAESVARKMDMRPEDFTSMLAQGPGGPIWQERAKGLRGAEANFSYWQDSVTVAQMQSMMTHLDAHAGATGFVPSYELRRVTSSPGFMAAAQNGENGGKNATFGGFLANAAGGGNFIQNAEAQASLWTRAYQTYQNSVANRKVSQITSLNSKPVERAGYILRGIPGLSPVQEQLVLGAVQGIAESRPGRNAMDQMNPAGDFEGPGLDDFELTNRAIDSFIMSGTSENPQLKAALGVIRKQWGVVAPIITEANRRLAEQRPGG